MTADQGVPGDHDPAVREMEHAVPARVAGGVHGEGPAGQVERTAPGRERLGRGDRMLLHASGADRVHRPRQHAGTPGVPQHVAHGHLVQELPAGVRHFGLVRVDGRAMGAVQVLRRTEMVVVGVGEEHRHDRLRRTPHLLKGVEDEPTVPGISGVHQCGRVAVREDHPVGVAAVHEIDGVGDLAYFCPHDRSLPGGAVRIRPIIRDPANQTCTVLARAGEAASGTVRRRRPPRASEAAASPPQRTPCGRNCTLMRGPAARVVLGTQCSQVR